MRSAATLLLLIGLTGLLSSCGYKTTSSFGGKEGPATRLSFGLARNQISPPRPGIEYFFTRRLKAELAQDRRYELSDGAPLTLEVTLIDFEENALVRDLNNVQQEVSLRCSAQVRVHQGASEVRSGKVSAWTSYAQAFSESRIGGFERLWRELSREVLDYLDDDDWLKKARDDAEAEESKASKEASDTPAKG